MEHWIRNGNEEKVLRVLKVLRFDGPLWPEGCGGALLTAPLALRVLKFDGALAPKVLRFDSPSG